MGPDQCALFASGSQAAAEAPPREPPWSHVHMRRLGLDTGPLQHVPLASRVLIKGFFTHPAAALLSGLGRGSVPSIGSLLGWGPKLWTLCRRLLCVVHPCELHLRKVPARRDYRYDHCTVMTQERGYVMVGYTMAAAMAAASTRRE